MLYFYHLIDVAVCLCPFSRLGGMERSEIPPSLFKKQGAKESFESVLWF